VLKKNKSFDQQMSLSKKKCWYSNTCLHFLKRAVPLDYGTLSQIGSSLTCKEKAWLYMFLDSNALAYYRFSKALLNHWQASISSCIFSEKKERWKDSLSKKIGKGIRRIYFERQA
jgi:hypothetical protein